MIRVLEDGWREEASEGPYTETLQTKDGWSIIRYYGESLFRLEKNGKEIRKFRTIENAKKKVDSVK